MTCISLLIRTISKNSHNLEEKEIHSIFVLLINNNMTSFISTFITVGICLAIYAYIKRKYGKEIQELQEQIDSLTTDVLKEKSKSRIMDDKLFVADKQIISFKEKLETLTEINKDLVSKISKDEVIKVTVTGENSSVQITDVDGKAPVKKKRGRKPGYKKPFYKKKSGGSPS